MKATLTFLCALFIGLGIQAQIPVAPTAPETAGLQKLKATNVQLLEKQAATLVVLEELKQTAQQIKIYSRRG